MKKSFLLPVLLIIIFISPVFSIDEKIILSGNKLYAVNRNRGFETSDKTEINFTEKNSSLPVKIVYPFSGNNIRSFSSLNINSENRENLSVTTPSQLFTTDNSGDNWKELSIKYPFKKSYYITASALKGDSGQSVLVGTSFSGIFETEDSGKSWKSYRKNLSWLDKGAGFYDDIAALSYGSGPYYLFLATGFTKKIYALNSSKSEWIEIDLPGVVRKNGISSLTSDFSREELYVYSGRYCFTYNYSLDRWEKKVDFLSTVKIKDDFKGMERRKTASEKNGIYLSAYKAGGKNIDQFFSFLKENKMNSVVVDFKDDNGNLTYNSEFAPAVRMGNIKKIIDIEKFIEKAKQNNIYVIARIVVFKDKQLYKHKNSSYAVWDRMDDKPWGNLIERNEAPPEQREFWVDPFSEEVWDYNIGIAEELEKRGVGEIQFDYIRFPTDGDLTRTLYRYKKEGMLHNEALESFLKKARSRISIPISTDLYGFNGWYRMGNWNGQQIDMVSEYVDVISPMFYPSHFPGKFLEKTAYLERAEKIYNEGSKRALEIVNGRSLIRPFVQAFLIGGELDFEKPVYTDYLRRQLKGLYETGASGFTLWNASGRYYMVSDSTSDYVRDLN
jgi:hypothetical protein